MKNTELTNQVAIVTGAGRGLGRAMALGLAGAGVNVVITAARERAEIEAVAAEARTLHPQAQILPVLADVTQPSSCAQLIATTLQAFGRLDILINNAGRGMKYVSEHFLTQPTRFWEVDPETWRLVIDTNVNGPFFMTRAAVPVMLKAGWGRIINISMNHETMRRAGFFTLWSLQGGAGVRNHHLGAGSAGQWHHGQRPAPRRGDRHRHDPRQSAADGAPRAARSRHHRAAAAVSSFRSRRWRDWPTRGRHALA